MGVDLRACRAALVRLADDDMILDTAIDELAALRERCKPTAPPYLPCLWHPGAFDDTCPYCLRHRLAEETARLRAVETAATALRERVRDWCTIPIVAGAEEAWQAATAAAEDAVMTAAEDYDKALAGA